MRFVPTSAYEFNKRITDGTLPTHVVDNSRRIRSADLDARADIAPADPMDPHPLARLATTLGALADMVSEERRHPGSVDGLSDEMVRDATARVMSWLAVAGRYTLRHGPIADGGRPLAIAQYAELSIGVLGGGATPSSVGLDGLSARIATAGPRLSERLDRSLQHWAVEARQELKRTIPSTQVMANIASVGTLMMATTHRLHTLSPSTTPEELVAMTSDLRGAADALKDAETAWKTVTTLQPQGRAFGVASYELFDTLRKVLAAPSDPEKHAQMGLDAETAHRSLEQGVRDLGRFVEHGQDATRACLNSGLLFEPARGRDNTADHLQARSRGEYLPLATDQGHAVMEPVERAAWRAAHAVTRRFADHAQPSLTLH